MADETSWAAAPWVKYSRIEAILLSSRYAARPTLLMCCCIDSVWSRWTPRFLSEDLNGVRLPPMSTLSLPTELRREVDATGRTSVFSAFSVSLLLYIQSTRLSMQLWISQRRDWNWSGGAPFDNWVSSAYLRSGYMRYWNSDQIVRVSTCLSCAVYVTMDSYSSPIRLDELARSSHCNWHRYSSSRYRCVNQLWMLWHLLWRQRKR